MLNAVADHHSKAMNATMRMSVALAVLLCAATLISAQPGNGGPFGGGRNNGGGGGGSSNGGSSSGNQQRVFPVSSPELLPCAL